MQGGCSNGTSDHCTTRWESRLRPLAVEHRTTQTAAAAPRLPSLTEHIVWHRSHDCHYCISGLVCWTCFVSAPPNRRAVLLRSPNQTQPEIPSANVPHCGATPPTLTEKKRLALFLGIFFFFSFLRKKGEGGTACLFR